jgi:16S rRNA (cytosine967-C5)-methyltransferase
VNLTPPHSVNQVPEGPESSERLALHIIALWENGEHTIDWLLTKELTSSNLESKDRARVTDWVTNWCRLHGTAEYLLNHHLKLGIATLPPILRRQMELTICRLIQEERTPKPILIDRAVEIAKGTFGVKMAGMTNAVLRKISKELSDEFGSDPQTFPALFASHPTWLLERWRLHWDDETIRQQILWDNARPATFLRWNGLKGEQRKALETLTHHNISFKVLPEFPDYFHLLSPFQMGALELVNAGYFSVQDPSAALPVRLLNPKPGMTLLDLCAAPGGKTTYMAELMGDSGEVWAVDLSHDRLRRIKESLHRLGISCVKVIAADGVTIDENPELAPMIGKFDGVLIDAPCSGLGVLSRRADLRWKRKPEDFSDLTTLQRKLLTSGAKMVRPGGALVYSTCTIEPEENEELIASFLKDNPSFEINRNYSDLPEIFYAEFGSVNTLSPRDHIDGSFAARMIKKVQ